MARKGRRGLTRIQVLCKIVQMLITAANNSTDNIITNRKLTKTGKQKCEEKRLCGYFKRQNTDINMNRKKG